MQLSELSSCNSTLHTQLRELESVNSMQATEPQPEVLQVISSNNTRKGQMHLQKCNVKIWNALAKSAIAT